MLVRMLSKGNTSSFLIDVHISITTLDNNFVVSHKFLVPLIILIFHKVSCTYLDKVHEGVFQEESFFMGFNNTWLNSPIVS